MPDRLEGPAIARHAGYIEIDGMRFEDAVDAVATQLDARALVASGPSRRLIEVAAQIARDPELEREVRERIVAGWTAERAVFEAAHEFAAQLAAVGGVTAARGTD